MLHTATRARHAAPLYTIELHGDHMLNPLQLHVFGIRADDMQQT